MSDAVGLSLTKGIKKYLEIEQWSHKPFRIEVASLLIRLYATIVGFARSPTTSIKAFPKNWFVACTSSSVFDRWAIVPGDDETFPVTTFDPKVQEGNEWPRVNWEDDEKARTFFFARWIERLTVTALVGYGLTVIVTLEILRRKGVFPTEVASAWLWVPIILVSFFISILSIYATLILLRISYRFSVKASALVWLPLLFAMAPTQWKKPSAEIVDDIAHGALSKVTVLAAFLTITSFLFWPLIAQAVANIGQDSWPELVTLAVYVYPWEVAALTNAILVVALWVYCDYRLRIHKFRPERVPSLDGTAKLARRTIVVRRIITIYLIPNSVYFLTYLQGWTVDLRFQWQLWKWG